MGDVVEESFASCLDTDGDSGEEISETSGSRLRSGLTNIMKKNVTTNLTKDLHWFFDFVCCRQGQYQVFKIWQCMPDI